MVSTLLMLRQQQRKSLLATASRALSSSSAATGSARPLSDMLRDLKASEHFDLIVIGSGPAGQKCAIDSAKHGKSVAIVDKRDMHGGVCVHTGTVPSKVHAWDIITCIGVSDRNHASWLRERMRARMIAKMHVGWFIHFSVVCDMWTS